MSDPEKGYTLEPCGPVITQAEMLHIIASVEGAMEELQELHPGNYYVRELRDALKILRGTT